MTLERVLRLVAAAAAAFGVYAVVAGEAWAAFAGGMCAVAAASIVLRSPDRIERSEPERDAQWAGVDLPVPVDPDAPRLLSEQSVHETLRSRIAVARGTLRPLSVVHVEVTAGGDDPAPVAASVIATATEETLRDSDVVGHRADGVYVLVLEDTGEDGAVWTTERLRRQLAGSVPGTCFRAGVATYPTHGRDAAVVDRRAAEALVLAREWRQDRIEVAAEGSSPP